MGSLGVDILYFLYNFLESREDHTNGTYYVSLAQHICIYIQERSRGRSLQGSIERLQEELLRIQRALKSAETLQVQSKICARVRFLLVCVGCKAANIVARKSRQLLFIVARRTHIQLRVSLHPQRYVSTAAKSRKVFKSPELSTTLVKVRR